MFIHRLFHSFLDDFFIVSCNFCIRRDPTSITVGVLFEQRDESFAEASRCDIIRCRWGVETTGVWPRRAGAGQAAGRPWAHPRSSRSSRGYNSRATFSPPATLCSAGDTVKNIIFAIQLIVLRVTLTSREKNNQKKNLDKNVVFPLFSPPKGFGQDRKGTNFTQLVG